MSLKELRQQYHQDVCTSIIRIVQRGGKEYLNFADGSNRSSVKIAWELANRLNFQNNYTKLQGQTTGIRFERCTKNFLAQAFNQIAHLRPGKWQYSTDQTGIANFAQYEHLAHLARTIAQDKNLAATLGGDYIIKPDIVVARSPVTDNEINANAQILTPTDNIANYTPFRTENAATPGLILHASISCKWTIRSDRSQNTRTEALNLIRNRKGHLPHIIAVTAEPLPTRIASLALGTGDLDCVYHFALPELIEAIALAENEDQLDMLKVLVDGKRLRDISDIPFDLAV